MVDREPGRSHSHRRPPRPFRALPPRAGARTPRAGTSGSVSVSTSRTRSSGRTGERSQCIRRKARRRSSCVFPGGNPRPAPRPHRRPPIADLASFRSLDASTGSFNCAANDPCPFRDECPSSGAAALSTVSVHILPALATGLARWRPFQRGAARSFVLRRGHGRHASRDAYRGARGDSRSREGR